MMAIPTESVCEDPVLDGTASKKGSKGMDRLDCIRGKGVSVPRQMSTAFFKGRTPVDRCKACRRRAI